MLISDTRMTGWPSVLAIVGPGGRSEAHAHHALHLVLARSGMLRVQIGEQTHEVAGVLTSPDARHAIDGEGRDVVLVFVDPESHAGAGLERLLAARQGSPWWIEAAERDAWLADLPAQPSALELESWTRAWLTARGLGRPTPLEQHPKVRKLLADLRERPLDGDLSLPTLAAELGLSPSRLMHVFTDSTGLPLRAYLRWLRVQRAAAAIAAGRPLAQAAAEAGFSDAAHMTRSFRDMFGLPPSALADRSQFVQAGAP
jgi:AraC-like DNA-binding protein